MTAETQESSDTASEGLTETLAAEIGDSVGAAVEALRAGKDPEPDLPDDQDLDAEDEVAEEAPEAEPEKQEAPAKAGLSNEVIERAVKAGLSLEEINQYPSEALLSAMCGRIEGPVKEPGSQDGAGVDSAGEPDAEDLLSAIPDLDPDEFDERIVSGFKSLKEIIRRQSEKIASMEGGQKKDWFATQLEGVSDFTKGDPAKAVSVKEKFDVLKAGYRAAGKDVPDKSVFDEAAQLVLGSDMEAARVKEKGNAARRRSRQLIQRSGGSRAEVRPDATSEIASMLDAKFFS